MDKKKIAEATKSILEAVGADLTRADIKTTPDRVADMYQEILAGTDLNPEEELEVILEEDYDELVLLKDIPLYSVCEHHMLPFIGKAHVAYIPDEGRITGLSKLARVVEIYARRLQVQERLTTQIADCIMKKLKPKGVLVIIEAEHLCMTMRGVKKPGSRTITSAVRGIFRENEKTRAETLTLIKG